MYPYNRYHRIAVEALHMPPKLLGGPDRAALALNKTLHGQLQVCSRYGLCPSLPKKKSSLVVIHHPKVCTETPPLAPQLEGGKKEEETNYLASGRDVKTTYVE